MFIKPCEGKITSPFGWRLHPISGERQFHKGIDIAQRGTVLVHAAADGVVVKVAPVGTYGNTVLIGHTINGKQYETNYAHLRNDIKVVIGQRVKQGQLIAYMGNTGGSTGQHLHFEIHDGRWAKGQPNAVDPLKLIGNTATMFVQQQLNKVGYKLATDGVSGPLTEAAIKSFQKKSKLKVDGLAGPVTLEALKKAIEAVPASVKRFITIVGVKQSAFIVALPSTRGKPIATIDLGKTVEIIGSVPGWWEVKHDGRLGYINEKFGRLI